MSPADRLADRKETTEPLWKSWHAWLEIERSRVPDGSATAKALDYSLRHWTALTRNLLDGDVPVDNNHLENQIRPWGQTSAEETAGRATVLRSRRSSMGIVVQWRRRWWPGHALEAPACRRLARE